MKDRNTCPVCGKPGIPDYLSNDVVCPQCGSDLSVYKMLHENHERGTGRKWLWLIPIIALAIALVVLGVFSYRQCNALSSVKHENREIKRKLAVAKDSITSLKVQLRTSSVVTPKYDQNKNKEIYIVRQGDSFWKISQHFFKRGAMASRIARDNKKQLSDVLFVGDTLIINH